MSVLFDKILCVDDDPITLMLCKKVIEKAGLATEIDTAKNGQDALEYFQKLNDNAVINYPKLIFLDLNMPILNGWEFLNDYIKEGLDKVFPLSKFIVLSSTVDPADISNSKKYDVVIDFISKPITVEILENLRVRFEK